MKFTNCFAATLLLIGAMMFASPPAAAEALKASANSHVFALPPEIGDGESKDVSVLVDENHLKLATIALRGGTSLPPHSTPVPATIQVLKGEGVINVESDAVAVSSGTIVLLAAGAEHDVVPNPGSDMLLLVHYLRTATGTVTTSADHEH